MNGNTNIVLEPTEKLTKLINEIAVKLKLKNHRIQITEKFDKGENYMGEIQRAVLKYSNENDAELVYHLLIKTAVDDPTVRKHFKIEIFYKREIYAYTVFLKSLDELQCKYNIPQNEKFQHAKYFGSSDELNNEIVMFEDLSARGFKMYDRLKSLDYDHLMLIIQNIANYHATSFAAKVVLPKEVYKSFTKNVYDRNDMGSMLDNYFGEMCAIVAEYITEDDIKERFIKYCASGVEKYYKYINSGNTIIDDPYYIITHGDFWINNMLFKYENNKPSEMIMVDWQIIKYTSPITDVLFMLFSCTDEDVRIDNWDEIWDTYYKTLRRRLIELSQNPDDVYPEDVFKDQLKEFLGYGLLTAVYVVPLVLNKREDSVDLGDVVGEKGIDPTSLKQSQMCVTRLRGVVKQFADFNII